MVMTMTAVLSNPGSIGEGCLWLAQDVTVTDVFARPMVVVVPFALDGAPGAFSYRRVYSAAGCRCEMARRRILL